MTALEDKFEIIYDVYDDAAENKIYGKDNPFIRQKASDFKDLKI